MVPNSKRPWARAVDLLLGDLHKPCPERHGPGHPALCVPLGVGVGPEGPIGSCQPQTFCGSVILRKLQCCRFLLGERHRKVTENYCSSFTASAGGGLVLTKILALLSYPFLLQLFWGGATPSVASATSSPALFLVGLLDTDLSIYRTFDIAPCFGNILYI